MDKKSILIFGVGFLQKSLIEQCKLLGLFTVGIDPMEDAFCKNDVDAFEVVGGQDYEGTVAVVKKYNISGIVTVATDKPLVMMARVAKDLNLPFYSEATAIWSTDKLQMKERFMKYGIPCAKGVIVNNIEELAKNKFDYPVIVKPRDNSGSRGVIYCNDKDEVVAAMNEALQYTKKGNVLVEEFIEGQEYSIESLHFQGKTHVVQFTKKITTKVPYNVELGHIQPADLSDDTKKEITRIIEKVANALNFDNCGSHTELKMNSKGITVIETSPRLGGDFITSKLVPLSTGINIENLLARMSIGETIFDEEFLPTINKSSGVVFFELPEGKISCIGNLDNILKIEGCIGYEFDLKVGDTVNKITSSLNRYGWALFQSEDKLTLLKNISVVNSTLIRSVNIA